VNSLHFFPTGKNPACEIGEAYLLAWQEEFPEGSAGELLEKLRSRLEETGQWSEWIDRVALEGAPPPYYPPERRPMPPQDT
jgi:hypothetical protein